MPTAKDKPQVCDLNIAQVRHNSTTKLASLVRYGLSLTAIAVVLLILLSANNSSSSPVLKASFGAAYDSKVTHYTLRLHYLDVAPDGVTRRVIGANGKPAWENVIRVPFGNTLSVQVINELNEPATIHWHGLYQRTTCYFDGAGEVTQCPIPAGASLLYEFKIEVNNIMFSR